MARKTMWAFAGALLAFAPLASAATYGMTTNGLGDLTTAPVGFVNTTRVYASEVVSDGDVQIDYRGNEPRVRITLGLVDTEVVEIDRGDVISVTITLANAKFGRNVGDGNMTAPLRGGIIGCTTRVVDTEDGEKGQSTVTFDIEAADGDCACPGGGCTGPAFDFDFDLPRLEGLNKRAVTVTVSTDRPGGSGWPHTEATGVGVTAGGCTATPPTATTRCVTLTDGNLRAFRANRMGETGDLRQSPLIEFASGLTFGGSSGGSSSINLAAGRTSFVPPLFQAILGGVQLGVTTADACTGATPTPAGCYLQSDGRPFSISRTGEGRGDLVINVTGDFRRGDLVYLDLDGNWTPGTGESLNLVDGSMEGAFNLLDVAGNAGAGDGDAAEMDREEGIATKRLLYFPSRTAPLRPGGYRTSWSVDFGIGSVSDKPPTPASTAANTHRTQYTLIEDDQVAYAIPPGTTGDVGQVRVKCEVATQCTIYLECDHADGRSWFSQVTDPIPGRSTLVLTSEGMRDALEMDDDDWTRGRMSCTVYSTREISLQVLTRSSTGVLVNNTYVDD